MANVGTRSLPYRQSDDTVQRSKRLPVSMFHRTPPARRSGCDTCCYSSYTGGAGAGRKEIYSNCGNIVLPLGFTSAGRTCTHNKRKADALSTSKFVRDGRLRVVICGWRCKSDHPRGGLGSAGTHLALMDALASSACRVSIAASLERCSSASLCNCFTSSSMRSGYPCSPTERHVSPC